jgi:recombinational DNA repair ATPase RecF
VTASRDDDATIHPRRKPSWVRTLRISAFRGVTGTLHMDFGDGDGPRALLLLGDNGSGKSSIVDALQFALQRTVNMRTGQANLAAALAGGSASLPEVSVELADGSSFARTVWRTEDGKLRTQPQHVPGFASTPLVLRRSDILQFWETPPEQRQLVFMRGSMRPAGGGIVELPQQRDARLAAERTRIKARKREAIIAIAEQADVSPLDIPGDEQRFNEWVVERFLGGVDPATMRPRQRRRLPAPLWQAIQAVRRHNQELRANQRERNRELPAPPVNVLAGVLAEASAEVTAAFREVSSSRAVTEIALSVGETSVVGLEVSATLANGQTVDPANVLSEANRDLLALLIFVGVARAAAERGQAKVIVLDDVFQSVDAPVRVGVMDYLLGLMRDWQWVLTAHDRLWREQLQDLLRRHGFDVASYEIVSWDLQQGPVLRSATGDPSAALRWALEQGEPVSIAVHAGRLLEQIVDVLSWTLPVSVKRRRGDRYTLGDLWPPVARELRRTTVASTVESIGRHLHLRNVLGAHANEWALSASLQEAVLFGESVLGLLGQVRCESCCRWLKRSPVRNTLTCGCGATQIGPAAAA